ncbi:unnamed protein product [Clonostachys byssicola]|uniref:Zn(2)-C6 fungal-type domain-containing protein n=1 Tax=Clonostachys byssicola TaxID=160290 RepID=A0A9N9UCG5_9HYPO|nr:unnamed protein product [Clonostachys byssicola]
MDPHSGPDTPSVRVFTRASKACRRCRRLRIRCLNDQGSPPCDPCRRSKHECEFPRRGEGDSDRSFRRPRTVRAGAATLAHTPDRTPDSADTSLPTDVSFNNSLQHTLVTQTVGVGAIRPGWETLPPYDEVVEGVQTLTTSYFQLGFLPKVLFFEEIRKNKESIDVFLLFSILSVSARFTPSLVRRYQGGDAATERFLSQATCLIQDRMFDPSLNSIQGFFLMSIAEWGNGDKNRSLIYMGIAVRLAGILRLHREDTYCLPQTASQQEVVYSEVARRTFWMLETFENLHSGSDSPIAFSYSDITVLLPCEEREFTFGARPQTRAALLGTPPAIKEPNLTRLPSRSLFATLLQTHSLWGQVARLVSNDAPKIGVGHGPRLDPDDYQNLSKALADFESEIPKQHQWSVWNLRGFKIEGLDLAYLSAVMVLRLSNIILRRSYVHDMLNSQSRQSETHTSPSGDTGPPWSTVSEELFDNMLRLHEQITAFFEYRFPDQGYPALIVFCVYVCGSLANHLRQQPQICPRVAPQAMGILQQSIKGLGDLKSAWPLAKRWYRALCRASDNSQPDMQVEPVLDVQPSHSISGPAPAVEGYTPDGEACTRMDVQFNDPFVSDSMFEVFETYLWGDMQGSLDNGAFGEVFPASSWN